MHYLEQRSWIQSEVCSTLLMVQAQGMQEGCYKGNDIIYTHAKFRNVTKIRTPSPLPALTWIALLVRVTSSCECAYEVGEGAISVDEFPVRSRLGYLPTVHDDYQIALGEIADAVGHQDSGLEGVCEV